VKQIKVKNEYYIKENLPIDYKITVDIISYMQNFDKLNLMISKSILKAKNKL